MNIAVLKKRSFHTLRINIKSLAEEARINRAEAVKTNDPDVFNALVLHRRGPLRREARYAQLALAFLRRMPYRCVEAKTRPDNVPSPVYLTKKLKRFVEDVDPQEVARWIGEK